MNAQQTINKPFSMSGHGLFGGHRVNATFKPAPTNHGIVFARTDLNGMRVAASIDNVIKQARRTTLQSGVVTVETCEHCLSALAALQIDNILIELDAAELPGEDGSAQPYYERLNQAGVQADNSSKRPCMIIKEPVVVREDDASITAIPSDEPAMQVLYELDYGADSPITRQMQIYDSRNDDYANQFAAARTFCLKEEAMALREAGLCTHLTEKDVLVVSHDGPINNEYRYQNELARHKIVDLIGDLYLLGAPVQGRIIACKSSHRLNHALARKLAQQFHTDHRQQLALTEGVTDIRSLMRMMPHRYPMLLIDRVLEIDGTDRIVGIKNVTINEPYFQGHYPTAPVMPGVLLVEAMAQLSGVLLGQTLEHTGKLGILMSLDRVKIRKTVTPGDQLIIEAQCVRIRSRIAQTRCKAFVANDVAAEAEIKFMLIDDDQE